MAGQWFLGQVTGRREWGSRAQAEAASTMELVQLPFQTPPTASFTHPCDQSHLLQGQTAGRQV